MFTFEVLSTDGKARAGRLTTPHGVIDTQALVAVGTLATVKGVTVGDLIHGGCQVLIPQYLPPPSSAWRRGHTKDGSASYLYGVE